MEQSELFTVINTAHEPSLCIQVVEIQRVMVNIQTGLMWRRKIAMNNAFISESRDSGTLATAL